MAEFFVQNRKWVALAILATGAMAAWLTSGNRQNQSPPSGEPLSWQDAPLEPAVAQPAWAVPAAVVAGQAVAPQPPSQYAPHNPLEAPFPNDDGQRPPSLGTDYPTAAPPQPVKAYRPEATRRTLLPGYEETPSESGRPTTHRIADGDTLPAIAERYLGDSALAENIFEANRDRLTDAEVLPIGLELVIPSASVEEQAPALPATPWPASESHEAPAIEAAPVAEPGMTAIAPGTLRRDVPSATALANATVTPLPPVAAVSPPSGARKHVVRRGDTLRAIARNYYGDAARWREIFTANQSRLTDPDRLEVGFELVIP